MKDSTAFFSRPPAPHIETMFHILTGSRFQKSTQQNFHFSKVLPCIEGLWRKPVSCRLTFLSFAAYARPTVENCKLPESHNTQIKGNAHTVKTGDYRSWLKAVEDNSQRFFFFLFFNVFVGYLCISRETCSSERYVTVAGCTPTEAQLTTTHYSNRNNSFKGYWDKKSTTRVRSKKTKFQLLFVLTVLDVAHVNIVFVPQLHHTSKTGVATNKPAFLSFIFGASLAFIFYVLLLALTFL